MTDPYHIESYYNLGIVFKELGEDENAMDVYRSALKLNNKHINALINLSNLYSSRGDIDSAESLLQEALHFAPQNYTVHLNIANLYLRKKDFKQALRHYIKAYDYSYSCQALAHIYHLKAFLCDWDELPNISLKLDRENLAQIEKDQIPSESPFLLISRTTNEWYQRNHAKQWAKVYDKTHQIDFTNQKSIQDKIRIGYVSCDFYEHPTYFLLFPLLEKHDKDRFEVFLYSHSNIKNFQVQEHLTKIVDNVIDINTLSDKDAAIRINEDNIDILIDLKGYTEANRLGIFGYKPAPIQISYLGYPGTTGALYIDYIIVDSYVTPLSSQKLYSEQFLYLKSCYQASLSYIHLAQKQKNFIGAFHFGQKITIDIYKAWVTILQKNPTITLMILIMDDIQRENLERQTPKRILNQIEWVPYVSRHEHLKRISQCLLTLDTPIYNGHTTTIDSLSVGIPVVTLKGQHFASRVTGSILRSIDLNSLVTTSIDEYIDTVNSLLKNRKILEKYQLHIIKMMKEKIGLFDVDGQVREIEELFIRITKNTFYKHSSIESLDGS